MVRILIFLIFINLLFNNVSNCQVFKTTGGELSDFHKIEKADSFAIEVKGLSKQINQNFGLAKVCINLTHERVSDLKVELLSPDGTKIWLTNRNGGVDGKNYINTCFRSNGL